MLYDGRRTTFLLRQWGTEECPDRCSSVHELACLVADACEEISETLEAAEEWYGDLTDDFARFFEVVIEREGCEPFVVSGQRLFDALNHESANFNSLLGILSHTEQSCESLNAVTYMLERTIPDDER